MSLGGSDPFSEINQVRMADGERGTGHDAGAVVAEQHSLQFRCDVDRGSIQRKVMCGFPSLLDPVDITAFALLQKSGDPDSGVANASAHFLKFGFQQLVLVTANDFRNTRLQPDEPRGDC